MNRYNRIATSLETSLPLKHLEVVDESHQHHVPPGAESHFKVVIVSEAFAGQNSVARRRRVQEILKPEFDSGLHALSIRALTPEEWASNPDRPFESPQCARK